MGDGAAAWNALNEHFDAHNEEARRACHNELFNLRHKADGDPVDVFTNRLDLKLRFEVLGEEVSNEVYQDIMVNALTAAPELRFIQQKHYHDEFTSVDHLQLTANSYYIDQRSRSAWGPVVSGRGAAVAVASSTDQSHQCTEFGDFSATTPNGCRRAVLSGGRRRGKASKAVAVTIIPSGAPDTTPQRTAMLSVTI